jgi:transcriptional regulator with GAF, ATPase, and Fis domain
MSGLGPRNVRELENITERAVIASQECNANLDRALPESSLAKVTRGGARRLCQFTLEKLTMARRLRIVHGPTLAGFRFGSPGKSG